VPSIRMSARSKSILTEKDPRVLNRLISRNFRPFMGALYQVQPRRMLLDNPQ
jgi:hypothetical protein